jgi:hypothetical protein
MQRIKSKNYDESNEDVSMDEDDGEDSEADDDEEMESDVSEDSDVDMETNGKKVTGKQALRQQIT